MQHIIQSLNKEQQQIVTSKARNILVLAGAGSGKTKVLVSRIVYLLNQGLTYPQNILAVTFTNKAAKEMKDRIAVTNSYLGNINHMFLGTFHSICHRLLKKHVHDANLDSNFQIIDMDDQLKIIKDLIKSSGADVKEFAKPAQYFINSQKEEGLRANVVSGALNFHGRNTDFLIAIYQKYEKICLKNSFVDFSELLLRVIELFKSNKIILEHYKNRFKYILVDEFQDTNDLQYEFLELLKSDDNSYMMVGDDDQAIYGWRGANVENMKKFLTNFANTEVIKLEQNYRSTKNILNAANAVISENTDRLGKNLWTDGLNGETVQVISTYNDIAESQFVISEIIEQVSAHQIKLSDIAILYRSNAQSRVFEENLLRNNIPYKIYGGPKFFDRSEVKDILAYLRLILNNKDDVALLRIINLPTRGIGAKTISQLRLEAQDNNISMFENLKNINNNQYLSSRAKLAVQKFVDLILDIEDKIKNLSLDQKVLKTLELSGLYNYYSLDKSPKGKTRLENLNELVNACKQFSNNDFYFNEDFDLEIDKNNIKSESNDESGGNDELQEFLSYVTLDSNSEAIDGKNNDNNFSNNGCINLMTLHSAKGLEFKIVFLVGMEDGLLPHEMSIKEPGRIDEERRLCYVGFTRAKEKLYLSYALNRFLNGNYIHSIPSRYIDDIPADIISFSKYSEYIN
tara:strand:+ start:2047 stop:4101 length:2055 start_codon:yes stop_codon:yes gene_type:complete